MRSCGNCKNRYYSGSFGMLETCLGYELAEDEADMIKEAKHCGRYAEGRPECLDDEPYCSSAAAGDYGPGNPWNAPGMSVRDFI